MTVRVSLKTVRAGLAGSTFADPATSASDSSGVTATLCGGADHPPGAFSSATMRGGETSRSMIDTVSGFGLGGTVLTPSTSTALLSFEDTAIWARAMPGAAAMATAETAATQVNWRNGMTDTARLRG